MLDDAYEGYMTLECDHGFGMDVTGDAQNVKAFRFACSSVINPIEHWVMKTLFPSTNSSYEGNSGLYSSITIGLGQKILNGEMVDIFMSNGYLVIKSMDNRLFLVIDPETGIVRDVMVTNSTFSYSSWCYSDQQTEWASDLGEDLLSEPPAWLGIVSSSAVGSAEVFGTASVLELSTAGTLMIEGGAVVSMAVAVVAMAYYPYLVLYEMPEKLRIMKEINDMASNKTELWMGAVALFLPDDREPTPEELREAQMKAYCLLMTMVENDDTELYNELIEIGKAYLEGQNPEKIRVGNQVGVLQKNGTYKFYDGGPDIDPDLIAEAIRKTCRFIKDQSIEIVNGMKAGDPVAIIKGIAGVTAGITMLDLLIGAHIYDTILESAQEFWEQDVNNTSNSTSSCSGGGG